MDRRQKRLIANIVVVITFTVAVVIGFANMKNLINRSESMRAMERLGGEILSYRQTYGSLPNENYVKQFAEQIGAVRLTNFQYRAQWIEYGSDPNVTVVAYAEKKYTGLVKSGEVVLWLNGKVEWTSKKHFYEIMESQQKRQELKWIQEQLQGGKNRP